MASKQKRLDVQKALLEWDDLTAGYRSHLAGRTAGQIVYDDAVIGFIASGLSVKGAVLLANRLYPSEALRLAPDTIDDLEDRYFYLARISLMDFVRENVASQIAQQPGERKGGDLSSHSKPERCS